MCVCVCVCACVCVCVCVRAVGVKYNQADKCFLSHIKVIMNLSEND